MFIADMVAQDFMPWQDKLAVLGSYDGERMTVHILYVDAEGNELIVDVLDSTRSYPGSDHRAITISGMALMGITSVNPAPATMHPRHAAPPPDPCRLPQPFPLPRMLLFILAIFIVIPISLVLFMVFTDKPYGVQLVSLVAYTDAVAFSTFSSRAGRPYLFGCPIVRRQLSRLLRRHIAFLAALFVVQTAALRLRPHLPRYLVAESGRDPSLFVLTVGILCFCLGVAQMVSNRSLLERAHLEFTPPDNALNT